MFKKIEAFIFKILERFFRNIVVPYFETEERKTNIANDIGSTISVTDSEGNKVDVVICTCGYIVHFQEDGTLMYSEFVTDNLGNQFYKK